MHPMQLARLTCIDDINWQENWFSVFLFVSYAITIYLLYEYFELCLQSSLLSLYLGNIFVF